MREVTTSAAPAVLTMLGLDLMMSGQAVLQHGLQDCLHRLAGLGGADSGVRHLEGDSLKYLALRLFSGRGTVMSVRSQ